MSAGAGHRVDDTADKDIRKVNAEMVEDESQLGEKGKGIQTDISLNYGDAEEEDPSRPACIQKASIAIFVSPLSCGIFFSSIKLGRGFSSTSRQPTPF